MRRPMAVALASLLILGGVGAAVADPGDIGHQGASYLGAGSEPTGPKPESKLWWNDGVWWASMWDGPMGSWAIFRLDLATQQWSSTGVAIDDRLGARQDALWNDGTGKLYVASHRQSSSSITSGYPAHLYRYTYDAGTQRYSLDAGFPEVINDYKTETLVIDQDTTGRLWATWVQNNTVYVNRTLSGDRLWGTPFQLPVAGVNVDSDDISALVAFGNRIGVMWSNQSSSAMYFAEHVDGDADNAWGVSRTALQGPGWADDHINLATLHEAGGRVFAVTKTSHSSGSAPLIMLLARDPATGNWSSHTVATVADKHTRPIVVLERDARRLHVFATGPQPPLTTTGDGGGTIYRKISSLDTISFPSGLGEVVMQDADMPDINDATSTKQPVDATTGLVVLAGNDTTDRYWHFYDPLGGQAPTPAPTTVPTPTPTPAPPGGETVLTPSADAYVNQSYPTRNYGGATSLRVRSSSSSYESYLRFEVPASLGSVTSARLRLYVTDASPDGGTIRHVGGGWTEDGVTWNTRPSFSGAAAIGQAGSVAAGWVEVALDPSAVVPGTPLNLGLQSASSNSVLYASREVSATPPTLVVTTASAPGPTPTATLAPTPTPAPSDTSTPTPAPTPTDTPTPTASPTAVPTPTPAPPSSEITVAPVADAYVNQAYPTRNYGGETSLRVRNSGSSFVSYLRFDIPASLGSVSSARLRVYVTDGSPDGGAVLQVGSGWTESGLTWNSRPTTTGVPVIGQAGNVKSRTWVEISLDPSAIVPGTSLNIALQSASSNSALYGSREATSTPPQLIIVTSPTGGALPAMAIVPIT